MRIRKKPWTESELQTNPHVVHNPADFKGRWNEYFKNDNPIYVEIGCGKGRFINENAKTYENINFIGIEKQETILGLATIKSAESENTNIAFFLANAENLLDFFDENEVSRLFINFCDPWPKKKWRKRRLTYRSFLNIYNTMLKDDAHIFFKTDNSILFESSLNEFLETDWQLRNVTLNLHKSGLENNIVTEYEEKFSSTGFPIYRLEATKNEK